MTDFTGKKILLFAPFGTTKHYGVAIKNELERRGAFVASYDERPSQSLFSKLAIRFLRDQLPYIFKNYIKRVIAENKETKFDYILICRGEAFTPDIINLLREEYPNVKIIFYLWDMLKCLNLNKNIPYADKAMSFDPDDCESLGQLKFRPTFFIPEYAQLPDLADSDSDVVFMGSLYLDCNRYAIVDGIRRKLKEQEISLTPYFFMPSILVFLRNSIVHHPSAKFREVTFTPISIKKYLAILNKAKAVLDVNYSGQNSLSTRAFECMAARRKYITTNQAVVNYDFYNPNNILVINPNNPIVPPSFLSTPFEPIPDNILYKYSVKGLVDDLFLEL